MVEEGDVAHPLAKGVLLALATRQEADVEGVCLDLLLESGSPCSHGWILLFERIQRSLHVLDGVRVVELFGGVQNVGVRDG